VSGWTSAFRFQRLSGMLGKVHETQHAGEINGAIRTRSNNPTCELA